MLLTPVWYLVEHRLHEPQCDLDPYWEEEPIEQATSRTINLLHAATAGARADPPPRGSYLTAPGLCYVFPLLKKGNYPCRFEFRTRA